MDERDECREDINILDMDFKDALADENFEEKMMEAIREIRESING